jgi:hypothetical protein
MKVEKRKAGLKKRQTLEARRFFKLSVSKTFIL